MWGTGMFARMTAWRNVGTLGPTEIGALEGGFQGPILRPDSPGFDEARTVWNGAIDRRPGLVLRAQNAEDVVAAVRFARECDLELTIRGGGHGVGGHAVADGAVLLDMTAMRDVHVDPGRRSATTMGGALWEDFDTATGRFGLATTGGRSRLPEWLVSPLVVASGG